MDSNVYKNIINLGHVNNKREELRVYCKLKAKEALSNLGPRLLASDGADLLDCLFNGLTESTTCSTKVEVINIVLKTMRNESTSLTHCGDIISRLCLELPKLPVKDLLRWSNDSVQSIVDDSDINMIWRDILPECVNIIASQDNVIHCGTEMSGEEYKVQCVHTLCQCRWQERQLAQLAAMFKDMQLLKENQKQAVNKLCSYILDVPPDTLPPLIHQMLKLCRLHNLEIVLAHLSHYFNIYLYNKLEPPQQDSESTTMDIEDIAQHSHAELSRCLSTCLYHITQGAAEPELIRKHIKQWPKTQLLRNPFLIDLALAVSDKGSEFRSVCLDVIKSAIEQRELDEIRSNECAWMRSLLPPDINVANVLKVLTTESANHRQLTVVGLIQLGFVLLSAARVRPAATALWARARLLLARLARAQPETAPHMLSRLADRLCGDPSLKQYSECLSVLCKLTPVSVERCSQLSTILENCQVAGDLQGAAVYDAVRPLVAFSTRVRDTLVMVCRKGLYSRESRARQLALAGLLAVLRGLRLSAGCSQPDLSAASYFTQLTVDLHASQLGATVTSRVRNETICLEVVSILRRCLVQDAAVKQLLYTEMYDCAKEKPGLHEPILELFYEHLIKYIPDGKDDPPILFDKCVQVTASNAVLLEPIGHLLYVVAQFLQPREEESDDLFSSQGDSNGFYKNKLLALLDSLCKRDLFPMEEIMDLGLNDLTPESKAKAIKVQQILQCYEALMAHQVLQWSSNNSNADILYKMLKATIQLLDNTKVSPKNKKNKSIHSTLESKSQKSQKTQKGQKEKGKGVKFSNLVKDRAGPFKALTCLWDVKLCLRMLQLLHSDAVRGGGAAHRAALQRIRSALAPATATAPASVSAFASAPLVQLAALLYRRCVCRFQDICAFDDHSALASLELFKVCLDILLSPNYAMKLEDVLKNIAGPPEERVSAPAAALLGAVLTALQQLDAEEDEERDGMSKKLLAALVQVAIVLLECPIIACNELNDVILKFEEYVRTSKQECLLLIPPLLTASMRNHQEAQFLDEILIKLTSVLGLIDEEESSVEELQSFPAIDSRTGLNVLVQIWAHMNARFRCIEHLVSRARDLNSALNVVTHTHQKRIEKEVAGAWDGVVVQLCACGRWVRASARLRGAGERAAAAGARLYALLATLAAALPAGAALAARLERLLKLCGKKLSSVMDSLITYLEASQQQENASKVLRDAKVIPRLVLEMEKFRKNIIILGKKTNINYQQYLSLGTARDFRIKGPVLQEVLNALEQRADETRNDVEEEINDATTEILSPVSDKENDSEEERPKSKRRKV